MLLYRVGHIAYQHKPPLCRSTVVGIPAKVIKTGINPKDFY
ncbi:MAG: hypothetical protein ACRCSE_01265 [Vibrio sp.]